MAEATRPTSVRSPASVVVNLYCQVATSVSAVDVGAGRVVLRVGDDIQAVQLVGQLNVLRATIVDAAGALGHVAQGQQ